MESRYIDWLEAFKSDEWHCLGRQIMEERNGEWADDNPEGLEGDDYIPIYNCAYPLGFSSLDNSKIIRICEETSCTIIYNEEEDALYLALCGCGMDMSQSIALAYMIAYSCGNKKYGRIPDHMLFDVYKSGALSVDREQFKHIQKALTEGFESLKQCCGQELEILKQN